LASRFFACSGGWNFRDNAGTGPDRYCKLSLVTGKRTGNFAILGPFAAIPELPNSIISRLLRKFPIHLNREFF
jgi:hypothetical protein